jgi:hypothetical protein
MPNKTALMTITLSTVVFVLLGTIAYGYTTGRTTSQLLTHPKPTIPVLETPTPITPSPYAAEFILIATKSAGPVMLSYSLKGDPAGKGLAGLSARIIYDPQLLEIKTTDIKGLLPKPWVIYRKEIKTDGVITIEAIYPELGKTALKLNRGNRDIASLNFKTKKSADSEISIDLKNSLFNLIDQNILVLPNTPSVLTYEPAK